jgi:hypothetical protein
MAVAGWVDGSNIGVQLFHCRSLGLVLAKDG